MKHASLMKAFIEIDLHISFNLRFISLCREFNSPAVGFTSASQSTQAQLEMHIHLFSVFFFPEPLERVHVGRDLPG